MLVFITAIEYKYLRSIMHAKSVYEYSNESQNMFGAATR